jgi:CheY-like chemotaxis protein
MDFILSVLLFIEDDGYALIKKVRSLGADQGGDAPAIALTGYASSEEGQRLLSAGYQLHLAKPAEPSVLVDAIARLVGRGGKVKGA